MRVATWCATAVHGSCCRTSFPAGRMCIAPSGAGLREASSSRCMIGYGNCGGAARNACRSRVRRCWMRNRPAVLRRAVRAAMMHSKLVKGRKRNLVVETLGLLLHGERGAGQRAGPRQRRPSGPRSDRQVSEAG